MELWSCNGNSWNSIGIALANSMRNKTYVIPISITILWANATIESWPSNKMCKLVPPLSWLTIFVYFGFFGHKCQCKKIIFRSDLTQVSARASEAISLVGVLFTYEPFCKYCIAIKKLSKRNKENYEIGTQYVLFIFYFTRTHAMPVTYG